jgi:membrane protein
MNRKEFAQIAMSSLRKWQNNSATLRAAALAFFIILPLPSILLISVNIYSQIYGPTQGNQQLIQQISSIAGPTIGNLINQLLEGATNPLNSVFNSIFSIVFVVAGAIGAFAVLQDTFNVLWDVKLPKHRSIQTRIRERFVPFALVLGAAAVAIGWLEFTSLVLGAVRGILQASIGTFAALALSIFVQTLFSYGSGILLFAIIFKELPDTPIEWGDVWLGALIAGVAFATVNSLFGLYLQTFQVTSLAVAAGALIVLLLWIFVIAQILLYGAQFTKCYAETAGSHAQKEEDHVHTRKRLKTKKRSKTETRTKTDSTKIR